jgi:hypothetical protein
MPQLLRFPLNLRHARRSKQTSTVTSRDLLLILVTDAVVLESILPTSDYGYIEYFRRPGLSCDGNVPYRRLMSHGAHRPQQISNPNTDHESTT